MIKTNEFHFILYSIQMHTIFMNLVSYFCGSMSDIQQTTWYTLVSPLNVTFETFVFQKFLQAALEML